MFYSLSRSLWDVRGIEDKSTFASCEELKKHCHYDKDDHNDEDNDNCSNWLSILFHTATYAINVLIK